jgi:hypothetical protein
MEKRLMTLVPLTFCVEFLDYNAAAWNKKEEMISHVKLKLSSCLSGLNFDHEIVQKIFVFEDVKNKWE